MKVAARVHLLAFVYMLAFVCCLWHCRGRVTATSRQLPGIARLHSRRTAHLLDSNAQATSQRRYPRYYPNFLQSHQETFHNPGEHIPRTVGQIVARYSIPLGMVVGPTGMGAPLSMKTPGQKVKRHRRLHTWTAELLMEALRDKFATQSNSVRRAFREVAQPGCSCADEILCVFTSNRS